MQGNQSVGGVVNLIINEENMLLAWDTSTGPCTVALWHEGAVIAQQEELRPLHQARRWLPMMEEGLHSAGIWYSDVEHYAVCVGPGSFTGVRIGLTAARMLQALQPRTVHAATSLQAMAWGVLQWHTHAQKKQEKQAGKEKRAGEHDYITVVLNAGKAQGYVQSFRVTEHGGDVEHGKVGNAHTHTLQTVADIAIRGMEDIAAHLRAYPGPWATNIATLAAQEATLPGYCPPVSFAHASAVAGWALAHSCSADASTDALQPCYIRPPDATLPVSAGISGTVVR